VTPALVQPGRGLATALDDFDSRVESTYDRFGQQSLSRYPRSGAQPHYHDLQPFDPSAPLMIEEARDPLPRSRINPSGVPGDVEEMLPVFSACLQIGKLERAALILKRMGSMGALPGEELILLHNQYLVASLEQMRLIPDRAQAEGLHKWYELNIRSQGLPQTAETVACMLKASLLSEHGPRLDRLVLRYMGMAPGEAGLHVLSMADVLNDQDLGVITSICPTYNLSPDESTSFENPMAAEIASESRASPRVTNSGTESMPEVLSTPQKGLGLRTLKQTLSLFDDIPQNCDISTLPPHERREIQARLERDCIDAAVERWREESESLQKMGLGAAASQNTLNSRLYDWQRALEASLQEELAKIEEAEASTKKSKEHYDRCVYGPFLRQSTPSRLAAITILTTLNSLAISGVERGVPLSAAISNLSKVAEEDIRTQALNAKQASQKKKQRRMVHLSKNTHNPELIGAANSEQVQDDTVMDAKTVEDTSAVDKTWPISIKAKVGAALLSALIDTARIRVVKENPETKTLISQYQPAFSHTTQLRRGKKIGMVLPNKELANLMKREPRGDFLAKHLPMVVPPEPWTKFDKGGFLESTSQLVRLKHGDKDQKIYSEAAISRGDMDQVFKGLDVLGRTAWRINTPVLNVLLDVWNTGEGLADIPPLHPNIPIPPEPDSSDDPMVRRTWIRAVKAAENTKSGLHSVRCYMNFQLEIARAFRNQTFYFPHSIDFRGRAYPLPTYLNHMGADHVRALLRFGEGKELGEKGLAWLKIHLANVYGFDKASLKERESFAMDNVINIFDSATNPLTGNRWWLQAEDPWQCLATCFELKAALESPEPTKFMSHLPIHQDGTCNGLQHYAALGGDTWGAKQVNLEPGDRPADVYSAVADLVNEGVAKDVKLGNPFALAVNGKITRKVVKQTVMTNVYGVTFAGAKKQVCKQLDAAYPNLQKDTGFEPIVLASYIATLIFQGLSTMFRGAHDIQFWLGEIGGRVCRALTPDQLKRIANDPTLSQATKPKSRRVVKSVKTSTDELLEKFRSTIVWTTPLRMPVAQPYRKSGTRVVRTCLQDLVLTTPERSDPVNRRKQLQAFPPNFIHSLDATHMLLSALECDEKGLAFAAVHDSFWTHAADIGTMNQVLRDAFIRIHSEDVVGRLLAEFEARYNGSIYLAKVTQGTPLEQRITAFRKSGKRTLKDELLLEHKRMSLLRSMDPTEVEEGKAMTTPASIFEELSAVQDLAAPEDMEELGLGEIPDASKCRSTDESAEIEDDGFLQVGTVMEGEEIGSSTTEFTSRMMQQINSSPFAETLVGKKKRVVAKPSTIQLWLPLTFPAIPKKVCGPIIRLDYAGYF
jgi:DNA-directed RNA polymerase, mitochondrial